MLKSSVPMGVLVVGVVFHMIYVLSIFDIYFKSPVVANVPLTPILAEYPPPAKRLVVFVADGCRADRFFELNDSFSVFAHAKLRSTNLSHLIPTEFWNHKEPSRVPFLRHIIQRKGSWGISHTGVPTESRPGHVAMFAGMYEDVSAVTRGWQSNPVDFDSIFNQSNSSFLFGSPDIVPMFAKNMPHVHEHHYSSEEEDFTKDAAELDTWVYSQVYDLFSSAKTNTSLKAQLLQDKTIIFCHFLGIDSNGHAHRPMSREYLANVALVDRLTEGIQNLIEDFYKDDLTSYIFTADHGMSFQGSHGDGAPANTRTPLIVWGAGITPPMQAAASRTTDFDLDVPTHSHDEIYAQLKAQKEQELRAYQDWNLEHFVRKDVLQADLAPLAAALLGMPYPRNSVGVLPFTYLKQGLYRARAVAFNARALYTHAYQKMISKKKATLKFLFRSFPRLEECAVLLGSIEKAFGSKAYHDIEQSSQVVIAHALAGLKFYQQYDWFVLFGIITSGYLCWMAVVYIAVSNWPFSIKNLVYFPARATEPKHLDTTLVLLCIASATLMFLYNHEAPIMYYAYLIFPVVFSRFLFRQTTLTHLVPTSPKLVWVVISLELIAWGYFKRQVFSLLCVLMCVYTYLQHQSSTATTLWLASLLSLSIFPLIPIDIGDILSLVLSGGGTVLVCGVFLKQKFYPQVDNKAFLILGGSLVSLSGTMYALQHPELSAAPWIALNWALCIGSVCRLVIAMQSSTCLKTRLVEIMLAMAPLYLLLSISYEVWFYLVFCMTLLFWVEYETSQPRCNGETFNDIRIALWYLMLFKLSFFGTGNVASMSSFEISSTFRFVTVFSPFIMGALLVFKILLPMAVVTAAFDVLTTLRGDSPYRLGLIVVLLSNVLAVQFFYLVQYEGSWKEIGNSISNFGIVNAMILFTPILLFLTRLCLHYQVKRRLD
ncbi:GPI ethanolamine phosphate transferase [Thraustotheca clavata]|uniref:GPI ethanolamine phosphate transferase 1 n=1 Tax=Thraustotheca clavata TaxID=74557 RepID=A0A1V9ZPZ7_9STRA|nr:GPI ethanolamine phosphate transferase [Thraustotheca clavata]